MNGWHGLLLAALASAFSCVQAQELADAQAFEVPAQLEIATAELTREAMTSVLADSVMETGLADADHAAGAALAALTDQMAERAPELERGVASWYGPRFHGRKTASGEVFNMDALTAAHPRLPFGSMVRVKDLESGQSVDVRINDRGPHIARRVIDLSRAAASALGLLQAGRGIRHVTLTLLEAAGAKAREAAASLKRRTPRLLLQGPLPER